GTHCACLELTLTGLTPSPPQNIELLSLVCSQQPYHSPGSYIVINTAPQA
ncbi:hypothetical protein WG66_000927, partial [Moniliophthora roreri]